MQPQFLCWIWSRLGYDSKKRFSVQYLNFQVTFVSSYGWRHIIRVLQLLTLFTGTRDIAQIVLEFIYTILLSFTAESDSVYLIPVDGSIRFIIPMEESILYPAARSNFNVCCCCCWGSEAFCLDLGHIVGPLNNKDRLPCSITPFY